MVEPEMAYAQLDDVMTLGEGLIKFIVERVLADRREELATLERDISKLEAILAEGFPRVHYDEAVKILKEGFSKGELENDFEWGGDFGAPDETYISKQFDAPVFVHHFPAVIKAFYFERDAERPELALGVDLLAPEGYGEIIGGGERAFDLEFLENKSKHIICRKNLLNGIWIYADSAQFRTPVSEWASNAVSRGCAASNTSAKQFPFRVCCIV